MKNFVRTMALLIDGDEKNLIGNRRKSERAMKSLDLYSQEESRGVENSFYERQTDQYLVAEDLLKIYNVGIGT